MYVWLIVDKKLQAARLYLYIGIIFTERSKCVIVQFAIFLLTTYYFILLIYKPRDIFCLAVLYIYITTVSKTNQIDITCQFDLKCLKCSPYINITSTSNDFNYMVNPDST